MKLKYPTEYLIDWMERTPGGHRLLHPPVPASQDARSGALGPEHLAWLEVATGELFAPAVRVIAAETAVHLQQAELAGLSREDALRQLGDPQEARVRFRKAHLNIHDHQSDLVLLDDEREVAMGLPGDAWYFFIPFLCALTIFRDFPLPRFQVLYALACLPGTLLFILRAYRRSRPDTGDMGTFRRGVLPGVQALSVQSGLVLLWCWLVWIRPVLQDRAGLDWSVLLSHVGWTLLLAFPSVFVLGTQLSTQWYRTRVLSRIWRQYGLEGEALNRAL